MVSKLSQVGSWQDCSSHKEQLIGSLVGAIRNYTSNIQDMQHPQGQLLKKKNKKKSQGETCSTPLHE